MRQIEILWDFEIQTDLRIPVKNQNECQLARKNLPSVKFNGIGVPQKENKKKNGKGKQILGLLQRTKKTVEHGGDSDSNCIGLVSFAFMTCQPL